MTRVTIAIDAMGGDHGPSVVVPASVKALQEHPGLHLVLVGDEASLHTELSKCSGYDQSRLSLRHASQKVEMDESPVQALRYKKDSSMRLALDMVKDKEAEVCVSAGNTGALMAMAHFVLKTIEGVDRPAIISILPAKGKRKQFRMLDLGANVDSSAANLAQFAIMGSVLASAVDNIDNPSVYLLNIGEEGIKGNKQVKETAQLLSEIKALNYKGYIEGDGLFKGEADVIVCDGFVGNVTLKASEGAATLMMNLMREGFQRNLFTRLAALLAKPILKSVFKRIDPALYNGATFIGLQGIVIKSHGHAKERAFTRAISEGYAQAEKNVLHRISDEIEKQLKSTSFGHS